MRLIDADNFKITHDNYEQDAFGSGFYLQGQMDVLDSIDDAPTITPKPVWISINDRLPEVGEEVLVFTNGCIRVWSLIQPDKESADVCWEDDYGYFQCDEGIKTVTHWMPLPEPPKEE